LKKYFSQAVKRLKGGRGFLATTKLLYIAS